MARVDFYRLMRDPVARVVAMLAERALGAGERLLVVAPDPQANRAISEALWNHRPAAFLAHGPADGEQAADEPILLADAWIDAPANGAAMVVLADGQWRTSALAYSRSFLLFGDDRIDDARAAWRTLATNDAVEAHYWLQNDQGKWQEGAGQKRQSGG